MTSHSKSKIVSFSTPVSQSNKSTQFSQAPLFINKRKVAATCVDNPIPLEPTADEAATGHDLNAMTPSILNYFKKVRKTSTRNSNEKKFKLIF